MLPKRTPFLGPPAAVAVDFPVEVVAHFAAATREWAAAPSNHPKETTVELPPADHTAIAGMTDMKAHLVMQVHIDCLVTACAIKRQARAHLVAAKRIVLASDPHFGI